jgi:hypothetical protein
MLADRHHRRQHEDEEEEGESLLRRLVLAPFRLVYGPRTRFLLGALLLAGCLAWMHQNALLSADRLQGLANEVIDKKDLKLTDQTRPLEVPVLSAGLRSVYPPLNDTLLNCLNPGVAGLLLILSCLVRGWRIGIFVLPAATFVFLGPLLPIPDVGPLAASQVCLAAGAAVGVLGFLFGRPRTDDE